MKAGLLTLAALTAAASAHVHRRHHLHRRGDAVVYETEVKYVNAPDVVVYVDSNGNPIPTEHGDAPPPAYQAPAEPAKPAKYDAPKAPKKHKDPKPAPYKAPAAPKPEPYKAPAAPKPEPYKAPEAPKPKPYKAPEAPKPKPYKAPEAPKPKPYKAPEAPKPKPAHAPKASSGQGIVYSPYRNDGGCKNQDEVNADFAKINGYGLVRIYGTDCDQVSTVRKAASAKGMKLFVGIFDINQVQAEADKIIAAVKDDWSCVDTISVGNELVNAGGSVSAVVGAVNTARGIFKAAGYNGPIVTVDTFVAIIANPELCQCSDYAAANAHAFFDGGKTAEQAGDFILEQSKRVAEACGGKKVVITESGWPWQGASNGVAVPSKENQKIAIDGIKKNFSENIILFTAYDDLWKENRADTHGAECFWGFIEHSA